MLHRKLCHWHRFLCTIHRNFLPIFGKMLNFHLEPSSNLAPAENRPSYLSQTILLHPSLFISGSQPSTHAQQTTVLTRPAQLPVREAETWKKRFIKYLNIINPLIAELISPYLLPAIVLLLTSSCQEPSRTSHLTTTVTLVCYIKSCLTSLPANLIILLTMFVPFCVEKVGV